ncbi:MAG: hypothetical protein HY673_23590 [Chloroflexi bacterium]|nr:hypothetical protein [Chloroflexota bacterium]
MNISANRAIVIASIAVVAGFLLTSNRDYRWIGHLIAGLATAGFLAGTVACGTALAGRLKRPPGPGKFRLHRKLGIVVGVAASATFSYGLWVMLPQGKRLLDTVHGWFGIAIVTLAFFQIIPSLARRSRRRIRFIHRWTGYALTGLVLLQGALGALMSPVFTPSWQIARVTLPWLASMEEPWRPDGIISPREYYISRVVDDGNYEIHYRSDGVYIYVGLRARTTGWLGVGIEAGEGMGMENASIVFGYVNAGEVKVFDSFGAAKHRHAPDTELGGKDDVLESGGQEKDGFTVIEFKRLVNTGDKFDIALGVGVHSIIWAYGTNDDSPMHVARGRVEIDVRPR